MRQYTYEITDKRSKRVEHARATAASPTIARAQIVLFYGSQFDVAELFSDINKAHHTLGEIDCSSFPERDTAWLLRMVEGVTA